VRGKIKPQTAIGSLCSAPLPQIKPTVTLELWSWRINPLLHQRIGTH